MLMLGFDCIGQALEVGAIPVIIRTKHMERDFLTRTCLSLFTIACSIDVNQL